MKKKPCESKFVRSTTSSSAESGITSGEAVFGNAGVESCVLNQNREYYLKTAHKKNYEKVVVVTLDRSVLLSGGGGGGKTSSSSSGSGGSGGGGSGASSKIKIKICQKVDCKVLDRDEFFLTNVSGPLEWTRGDTAGDDCGDAASATDYKKRKPVNSVTIQIDSIIEFA